MKLSLIIPTYNERDNIRELLLKLKEEFYNNKIDSEIIVVDDGSPDGTGQILEELKTEYQNLKVIHREGKLGLSSAVLEGFKITKGDILGVMDADMSHDPQKVSELYQVVVNGADFVIGSRYIKGGKIKGWNLYRKFLSKSATILARVFTDVMDPMSGFFMIKKELINNKSINPKGFKILLELLIKTDYKNTVEIPIIFTNRTLGKSKANIKEIIFYLQNLFSYLPYKKQVIIQFFRFAFVGLIGTVINIAVLYLFTEHLMIYYIYSAIIAFFIAATFNFIFNKIWTFKEKLNNKISKKYAKFLVVSLMALVMNLIFLYIFTEFIKIYYLISQILAIGISLIINFIGNKIWTFQK